MSKIALVDYWAAPDKTLSLVSTTEGRGSELRIWGDIKDLFNRAREQWPELAGQPVDYLKTITSDKVDREGVRARSLRRGLIVVPCKIGGMVSGLAPFVGVKADRLRHYGDECSFMAASFLNAYSNWYGKEHFKGMMTGNYVAEDDPLGVASEPEEGWALFQDTETTMEWTSRFFRAHVVCLDGRDSPNFDPPWQSGDKPRFPYLVGEKKMNAVRDTHGPDSWQWYSQCLGKPVKNSSWDRVITRRMCEQHKAMESVDWRENSFTLLYALDPAYGGGDRCVGLPGMLGTAVDGTQILSFGSPEIVPIRVNSPLEPEDQIAEFVKARLGTLEVPPNNCFYDSFGRGTLGFAFAKVFGNLCPVPVDAGGPASPRPVRFDLFVTDDRGNKRLKRCDEHYSKFITELWFSMREAIESNQVRNFPEEVIIEASKRIYRPVRNARIEIEPKDDYRERVGHSPDYADTAAILVEGARQRGFRIVRAGEAVEKKKAAKDWLTEEVKEYTAFF